MAISNNNVGVRPGVCTSSTRPTAPYEGQMIYETDTDMVAIWNGTAWRYISATTPTNGTVLQIVSSTQTANIQNNTSTYADSGLSVAITPKSSSSKVLIIGSNSISKDSTNASCAASTRLVRGATTISQISQGVCYTNSAIYNVGNDQFFYLDSPATTSATTYKTQFASTNNNAGVIVNINIGAGNQTSYIVAMEISA